MAQNLPKHGSSNENVSLPPMPIPYWEGVPFSPLTPRFLFPNQAYWIRFYISREIQTDSEHCILASAAAAELISDRWYLLFIRLAGTGVIEAVLRSRLAQMHRRRAAVENWLPWKKLEVDSKPDGECADAPTDGRTTQRHNDNEFISDMWPIRASRQLGLYADIHERKIQRYAYKHTQ